MGNIVNQNAIIEHTVEPSALDITSRTTPHKTTVEEITPRKSTKSDQSTESTPITASVISSRPTTDSMEANYAEAKKDKPEVNNIENEVKPPNDIFQWVFNGWTRCSASCDTGDK